MDPRLLKSRSHSRTPSRVVRVGSNRIPSNRVPSNRIPSIQDPDTLDLDFQVNKHTILTNFEEWIRLSTDNKITLKNSWNFALIDYFHDLNVIKDGDKINFQRASATLDGCVKIYSSRVESAATETGKLLSGLAKENEKSGKNVADGNVDGDEDGDGVDLDDDKSDEDISATSSKKRKITTLESTLVPFNTLRIKKLDQELNIDPLFKKALSEFDEGGAKSLLLNTLNIDNLGRVVFDATTKAAKNDDDVLNDVDTIVDDNNINFSKIEGFLNLSNIDDATICPSINGFKSAITDFSNSKNIIQGFNDKFNEMNNDPSQDVPDFDDMNDHFDDNDNFDDNNGNDNNEVEGAENTNKSYLQQIFENEEEEDFDHDKSIHTTSNTEILDRDLMAYFDDKMKVNWKGPEHWKVSALKGLKTFKNDRQSKTATTEPTAPKKKNEPTFIDFFKKNDLAFEDKLFEEPKSNSMTLQKASADPINIDLPDDIRYNSSRLINLFQKPQISIIYSTHKRTNLELNSGDVLTDENFFAEQYKKQEEQDETERFANSIHQAEYEDFNNDFGGDDEGYNNIDFNDALNGEAKPKDEDENRNAIFKRRNEFITFSRVAKRVDIKLLKDNIWNTILEEKEEPQKKIEKVEEENIEEKVKTPVETKTKFADVVNSVSKLYQTEARKELSTSFCFICVLHLANEHNLIINANENHDDLEIIGF